MIEAARWLRSHPTPAEQFLWMCLRKRQVEGFKFRRQHIIGSYIVDFYCPKAKLIIEVDGEIHLSQKEYDQERTQQLMALGYRLLRFTNKQITNQVAQVLSKIASCLQTPTRPLRGHPSLRCQATQGEGSGMGSVI